jgi:hypothetical protein
MPLLAGPVLLALLSGCGPAAKYRITDIGPNLAVQGARSLAVATHDQRPYIRKDEKARNYLGSLRKAGIPYDVVTESEAPLAESLTGVLVAALSAKGFAAQPVRVMPHFTEHDAVKTATAKGLDRTVLLVLSEWMSDTTGEQTDLTFDLRLNVINEHRSIVATAKVQGSQKLTGQAGSLVPRALRAKLEQLFDQADIRAALQDPAAAQAEQAK